MQRIELIEKDFSVFLDPSVGRFSFIRHYAAESKITHFDLPKSVMRDKKCLGILSQALPLGLNYLINVIQDLPHAGITGISIPVSLEESLWIIHAKNLRKDLEKLSEEVIKFLNERQDLLLTTKKENSKTLTKEDIESTTTIQDLPTEILLYILSFLSIRDLNQTLLISKFWQALTISNDIWRPFLQSSPYWDKIKQDDPQQTYFAQFKTLLQQSVNPNLIRLNGDLGNILEMSCQDMEKDAPLQNKLQNLIKKLGTHDKKSNFYFLLCDDFSHQSILDFLYGKEIEFEKISIRKSAFEIDSLEVPLYLAVKYNQVAKMMYLINLLRDQKLLFTSTLIQACSIAIKYHRLNIMKQLLNILKEMKVNINRERNHEGLTLLQQTIISESKYAFEILMIEWQADLHAVDNFGYTALHLAVNKKLSHWIEFLLDRGADPNFRHAASIREESPYYSSIKPLNIDIAKLIIAHAEKKNITLIPFHARNQYKTPLEEACDHQHPNINEIEKYLEQEPLLKLMSFHNPRREGKTPLHDACHPFTIIKLLEAGADPNAFDNYNSTPLHHAISAGLYQKSIILLQHGAKLDVKNRMNLNPENFLKISPNKQFKEKLLNWIKHTEIRNHIKNLIDWEILNAESNDLPVTHKVIVICKWYLNQTNRFAFHQNRKEEITFCQNLISHCNELKEKDKDLLKTDFEEKEKQFFQENKSASDNFKAALEQIEWELLYRDNTPKNNQTKLIEEPIDQEQEIIEENIWNSFLESTPSKSRWFY